MSAATDSPRSGAARRPNSPWSRACGSSREARSMPIDTRVLDLFGIELPIIQAPMAGATTVEMVVAVSEAGGLGSLPSALYTAGELRNALTAVRAGTNRPINVNFFCHPPLPDDPEREAAWRNGLAPYYAEAGLPLDTPIPAASRAPFDEE